MSSPDSADIARATALVVTEPPDDVTTRFSGTVFADHSELLGGRFGPGGQSGRVGD